MTMYPVTIGSITIGAGRIGPDRRPLCYRRRIFYARCGVPPTRHHYQGGCAIHFPNLRTTRPIVPQFIPTAALACRKA